MYIVRCADNTFYTGISVDVAKRIHKHNKGKGARYTAKRLPVSLLVVSRSMTHREALRAERAVKRLHRSQKVEAVRVC